MGDRQEGAERRREPVDGAEPGVGEADPRQQAREGHPCARIGRVRSVRVRVPGEQPVAGRLEPGKRERIGQRSGPRRDVALEQLGDRVHAVRGDPMRPGTREQVRVDDRVRGDEALVAERALVAIRAALADDRRCGWPREPVPAVVGTATNGTDGPGYGRPGPTPSRWSRTLVPVRRSPAMALAGVQDGPATHAHDDVDARGAGAPRRPGRRRPATARRGPPPPPRAETPAASKPVEQRPPPAGGGQRTTARDEEDPPTVRRRRAPGRARTSPRRT